MGKNITVVTLGPLNLLCSLGFLSNPIRCFNLPICIYTIFLQLKHIISYKIRKKIISKVEYSSPPPPNAILNRYTYGSKDN